MPENPEARTDIMKSVALLVLDAQDVFIDTIYNKESFLLRTAFAIEAARSLRIRTIFTEQVPEKLGRTNRKLQSLAWKPRTFAKQSFSALRAPGLEQFLRENEIYHLVVCGLETPICVYQTALQAEEEDVDITLFTDALGCRRQEDEAPVLESLRKLNCELLPSETLFYSLIGDVGHPYFRYYNNVVKAYNNKEYSHDEFYPPEGVELKGPDTQPAPEPEAYASDSTESESNRPAKKRPRNRRSRNRGRGRRDSAPQSENASSEGPPSANQQGDPASAPKEKPQQELRHSSQEATAGEKTVQSSPSESTPQRQVESAPPKEAAETKTPPAKKAAKKAARKSAAKKVAKKAAKKVARKTAAKKAAKEAPPAES